jgi:hypothetical protein
MDELDTLFENQTLLDEKIAVLSNKIDALGVTLVSALTIVVDCIEQGLANKRSIAKSIHLSVECTPLDGDLEPHMPLVFDMLNELAHNIENYESSDHEE